MSNDFVDQETESILELVRSLGYYQLLNNQTFVRSIRDQFQLISEMMKEGTAQRIKDLERRNTVLEMELRSVRRSLMIGIKE